MLVTRGRRGTAVWAPTDLVGVFNGFEMRRALALMAIHLAIGISRDSRAAPVADGMTQPRSCAARR